MNILFSCIGRRGYIAEMFRAKLGRGDRLIATSNTPWTSGFKACDANYVLPSIEDPDYIPALLDICYSEKVDALLSFFDPDVRCLSQHKQDLKAVGVVPVLPDPHSAELCFDKLACYHFFTANGFRTALTFHDIAHVLDKLRSGELEFPLYVKPRFGFGSRNTLLAKNHEQLTTFFNLEPDMLVQVPLMGDAYDIDALGDLQGRPVSVVVWRKYLSRMGETEQAETVWHGGLLELGRQVARYIELIGPLDVDLFVEGEEISILELNPRFGGGYPVSHLAGADFPGKIIRMIRGEEILADIGRYDSGIVMMKDLHYLGGPQAHFFEQTLKIATNFPSWRANDS